MSRCEHPSRWHPAGLVRFLQRHKGLKQFGGQVVHTEEAGVFQCTQNTTCRSPDMPVIRTICRSSASAKVRSSQAGSSINVIRSPDLARHVDTFSPLARVAGRSTRAP